MVLVTLVFADVEAGDDEASVHDGASLRVVEEGLEQMAGAAPGRAEDEHDILVGCAGGGFGLLQDSGGVGRSRLILRAGGAGGREHSYQQEQANGESAYVVHGVLSRMRTRECLLVCVGEL